MSQDVGATTPSAADLEAWSTRLLRELYGSVLPFWVAHSEDRERGGFWTCLTADGACFDDRKYVWLQGRQIFMYCRLVNALGSRAHDALVARHAPPAVRARMGTDQLLESAGRAMEFLDAHVRDSDGHFFFALTRDGRPAMRQRKIYSACFYVLAASELFRATGEEAQLERALEALDRVREWIRDPALLGKPPLEGGPQLRGLAEPMIMMNLVREVREACAARGVAPPSGLDAEIAAAVERVRAHHVPPYGTLENVRDESPASTAEARAALDCPEGRLHNPGHAMEAAWFLMQRADDVGDAALAAEAADMLRSDFALGWGEPGGICYFRDALGLPCAQLEAPMRLWWPHCEAMVGFAFAFALQRRPDDWAAFERVAAYVQDHFCEEGSEWFGYLDREGRPTSRAKGGAYKGCFHTARALLQCHLLLERAAAATGTRADKVPAV